MLKKLKQRNVVQTFGLLFFFSVAQFTRAEASSSSFDFDRLGLASSILSYPSGLDGGPIRRWARETMAAYQITEDRNFDIPGTPIHGKVLQVADGDDCIRIVAIRGSLTIADKAAWHLKLCDWADCLSKGYLRLNHPAFPAYLVKFLAENKCSKVMFTGHSLAGVMAQAAAKHVSGTADPEKIHKILLYTFNSPGAEDVFPLTKLRFLKENISIEGNHHRMETDYVSTLGDHFSVPVITWRPLGREPNTEMFRPNLRTGWTHHAVKSFKDIFDLPDGDLVNQIRQLKADVKSYRPVHYFFGLGLNYAGRGIAFASKFIPFKLSRQKKRCRKAFPQTEDEIFQDTSPGGDPLTGNQLSP